MDTTERIQNAIEWANKRLTLQGQELSQKQKNYLTFALSQNFTDNNQALQLLQGDVSGSFLFEQDNLKTKDLVKISKLREDILMLIHTTDLSEKIIEFLLYPFEEILKHNGVNISVA